MQIQKFSRPLVILLATAVAIITSIVVANATQTITTPNAAFISYNLAAFASSAPITPATNRSVLVMGCCTTAGLGVGQVSLFHSSGSAISWTGLESPTSGLGGATITSEADDTAGRHIVFIDEPHMVEIKTTSANTILVLNGNAFTAAGNVTLIW